MDITEKQEIDETLNHLRKMLLILQQRLRHRELQEAQYGINVPPEIVTEISDLSERIRSYEAELRRLQSLSVEAEQYNPALSNKAQLPDKADDNEVLVPQVGLLSAKESAHEVDDVALREATASYWFMGISALYLRTEREFLKGPYMAGRSYRFLLLDPASTHVESVEEREEKEKGRVKENIRETINEISLIRSVSGANIQVRLYDELPTFRIIIVNEAKCYVSFYSRQPGVFNPLMIFRSAEDSKDDKSFYTPFLNYFIHYWEISVPLW